MQTLTIEEAQANLPHIIDALLPGDSLLITRDNQPVAKIVGEPRASDVPRKAGSCKEMILHIADDFNAPLEEFREYME
jgi:antitoxin (DNA-binding transcriptional repressor) of toxin-antitoxin stability system